MQLLADQSGVALGAAMCGAVLLMFAGTQILDWYWLFVLFVASLALGLWRMWRRLPSAYTIAQQIDTRLSLADTLSTAWHFSRSAASAGNGLREAQRAQAESTAQTVDAAAVFPIAVPKALYAAAAIAAVAIGMFGLRYGITRSLDLRPSMMQIAYDNFFQPSKTDAAKKSWKNQLAEQLQKLGIGTNPADAKEDELDPARESALTAQNSPETSNTGDSDKANLKAGAQNEQESGEPGGDEKSERASNSGQDKGASEQPPEGNDGGSKDGQQTPNTKNGKESQGQNSSLMDKMRDAMSSLMDKLKSGSKQGDNQQNAKNSQNGSQSQQQGKGDKQQMAGKQQSEGGEQQDAQGQQQAQADQGQNAKAKSGDRNADQKASQEAKSGIGKQDGDKSAREAAQLEAMGKISEILGKRAKDMTGEVMVEVSGGKQQLKTQYSSKTAAHAEAGGEINRDEVPLEYQQYVQQYFEQIRKPGAPAPKK